MLSCCILFVQVPVVEGFKTYCVFPLQDVVNVVGGIGVLLPLLEQVCEAEQVNNGSQEISDQQGLELTAPRSPAAMLLPLNKSAGQVSLKCWYIKMLSISCIFYG